MSPRETFRKLSFSVSLGIATFSVNFGIPNLRKHRLLDQAEMKMQGPKSRSCPFSPSLGNTSLNGPVKGKFKIVQGLCSLYMSILLRYTGRTQCPSKNQLFGILMGIPSDLHPQKKPWECHSANGRFCFWFLVRGWNLYDFRG